MSTPAPSGTTSSHSKKKSWGIIGILVGLAVLLVWIKSCNSYSNSHYSTSVGNESKVRSYQLPPIPDKSFKVSKDTSDWQTVSPGYYVGFLCPIDYVAFDGNMTPYHQKAFTSPELGLNAYEKSTAKLRWRFLAENKETADLTIQQTPMNLQK